MRPRPIFDVPAPYSAAMRKFLVSALGRPCSVPAIPDGAHLDSQRIFLCRRYDGCDCVARGRVRQKHVEAIKIAALQRANPKSFTSVRRNRPAHADESSQWRARFRRVESNGGTHGDWRVSRCHCSSRVDFVGRVGAVNAGRLVPGRVIPKCLH